MNDENPDFTFRPIGYVKSPYREQAGTPIQANFGELATAEIRVLAPFRDGLSDLDGFSHVWLLTWLDRAKPYELLTVPYRDTVKRGLFATRAPSRPNPIGLSCTRLIRVEKETGVLHVAGIDLLDGTPVLDIKPYIPTVDAFPGASSGWFMSGTNRTHADDRFRPDGQSE
jgi:tRNA-Thr(GGU) m(6)t(6)A37 methyltransferase TsaA